MVPAVGRSDLMDLMGEGAATARGPLMEAGAPNAGEPSLAELIRAGDLDAIAGFQVTHVEQVRSYCEIVCAADRVQEACDHVFLEFVGRVREGDATPGAAAALGRDAQLDELLLQATRSVSAARLQRRPASTGSRRAPRFEVQDASCAVMPELVAAAANGELRGDGEAVRAHVASCPACKAMAARLQRAERAFLRSAGWS